MNVTFQDTLRPLQSVPLGQSSSSSTSFCTSRQLVEQLKKFIHANESPGTSQTSSGASLSDAGFILLRLKDQLLSTDQRAAYFPEDFASRPHNGLDVLVKVVAVLQSIVNSVSNSSKISNLLTRTNSSSNRKRKAAVAEADCIECIKILLEKAPAAWRSLLESPASLDILLYSVHSPQLDSKCYALEIIILLLDQPHGFVILFRALSYIAARNNDFLRLTIFVSQLKHGLHTSKLHIQILVVRLLNKLLQQAPTPAHRIMAQTDAILSSFSPEHLEKLVMESATPLGGMDALIEELAVWRSLFTPIVTRRAEGNGAANQNAAFTYSYSEADSDTSKSDRARRTRLASKFAGGQTSVAKNIERQRLKRYCDAQTSNGLTVERSPNPQSNSYYPAERSYTHAKSWDPHNGYPLTRVEREDRIERRAEVGGMRRAKSESAMAMEGDSVGRGLKRIVDLPDYRPRDLNAKLSQSIHDLSRDHIIPQARPASATMTRSLHRTVSPTRAHFEEPVSENSKPPPIHGFSYLFPAQPVITKQRAHTPDPFKDSETDSLNYTAGQPHRPPSAPIFDNPQLSPDYNSNGFATHTRPDGQVVYIPINIQSDGRARTLGRVAPSGSSATLSQYDRRRQTDGMLDEYSAGSRSSSASKLRSSGSYAGTIGEDVKDALSQFDYLNDYEGSAVRGTPQSKYATTYHF